MRTLSSEIIVLFIIPVLVQKIWVTYTFDNPSKITQKETVLPRTTFVDSLWKILQHLLLTKKSRTEKTGVALCCTLLRGKITNNF